jgi:hemoglobin-like flavoprotein
MLDAGQVHLLRRTFVLIEDKPIVAALIFYRRLFDLDPSLRAMFQTDIEEQAVKLMEMLGWSLSRLERLGEVTVALESLGARHVGYGVRDEHYAIVGEALMGMLGEVLGEAFTVEARSAWVALYGMISEAMRRGASRHEDPDIEREPVRGRVVTTG